MKEAMSELSENIQEWKTTAKISKRIKEWKKIFTAGRNDIDEHSSWKEIFLMLDLGYEENLMLVKKALQACGAFSPEEKRVLYAQPWYKEVMSMTFFSRYLACEMFNGDVVYFLGFRGTKPDGMFLVEATIVTKKPVKLSPDVYIFMPGKNLIIRYAEQPPQEYLKRKKEDEDIRGGISMENQPF